MAEDKIEGLEGLDDFGDEFSEQLDSFMENEQNTVDEVSGREFLGHKVEFAFPIEDLIQS